MAPWTPGRLGAARSWEVRIGWARGPSGANRGGARALVPDLALRRSRPRPLGARPPGAATHSLSSPSRATRMVARSSPSVGSAPAQLASAALFSAWPLGRLAARPPGCPAARCSVAHGPPRSPDRPLRPAAGAWPVLVSGLAPTAVHARPRIRCALPHSARAWPPPTSLSGPAFARRQPSPESGCPLPGPPGPSPLRTAHSRLCALSARRSLAAIRAKWGRGVRAATLRWGGPC